MFKYTSNRNVQLLLFLLKKHGIRKVVASPGTMNVCLVASMQQDPFFELYSAVDERSAAYMACGMAAESREPVALSCTGATASRNYMPALTEAYYRKLPILAITATVEEYKLSQLVPQTIDRRVVPNDVVKRSVHVPTVFSNEDEVGCIDLINNALLELRHAGEGPVHINFEVRATGTFDVESLPKVRSIERYSYEDKLPEIEKQRVVVFVGNHKVWGVEETNILDKFCEANNAVVFCDATSNYFGKYRICPHIAGNQDYYQSELMAPDLMIHVGEVSGSYLPVTPKKVWRVSCDGEIRNTFKKLTAVFEMSEKFFFAYYARESKELNIDYYEEWRKEIESFEDLIEDFPFSNIWVAKTLVNRLPKNAHIHFGILNSLRSWNFFATHLKNYGYCNTGGFGIDGCTSTLVGASIVNNKRLFYGIIGDLSFFYDLNSIGNHHIGNNIRLLVINNGCGVEFKNYNHTAHFMGDESGKYVAAEGHYGNKSPELIRHYAESLGFKYISASTKEEFYECMDEFVNPKTGEKSVIFEVFTKAEEESGALRMIRNLKSSTSKVATHKVKGIAGAILGAKGKQIIKDIIRK